MQLFPLLLSGIWAVSGSIGISVPTYMSSPLPTLFTTQGSESYLLASTPPILVPLYQSPAPILSATSTVDLSPTHSGQQIYRYGERYDPVTYAWGAWRDIDFILMIQEESLWDEYISGDDGASIGYCQFNRYYSLREYTQYVQLTSWKARIDLCHEYYVRYRDTVGEVFHGWNSRERNLPSFSFR